MTPRTILLLLFLISYCHLLSSQKRAYDVVLSELENSEGKERIKLLLELCNQDIYSSQELARSRAKEAFELGNKIDDQEAKGQGFRYVGLSYFFEGELDSARVYYEQCAEYYESPKDKAWSFYNIASIFEDQSAIDSAEYYLILAEKYFTQDESLVELGAKRSLCLVMKIYKNLLFHSVNQIEFITSINFH